jgi:metallo-beta-lactamase family protein
MLPNPKHTVIMVGYQSMGTRGRALVDGARFVKMHGQEVDVAARIEQIQSFSVHADGDELVAWLATSSEAPTTVFTVHGEAGVADVLAKRVTDQLGWRAFAPNAGDTIPL